MNRIKKYKTTVMTNGSMPKIWCTNSGYYLGLWNRELGKLGYTMTDTTRYVLEMPLGESGTLFEIHLLGDDELRDFMSSLKEHAPEQYARFSKDYPAVLDREGEI